MVYVPLSKQKDRKPTTPAQSSPTNTTGGGYRPLRNRAAEPEQKKPGIPGARSYTSPTVKALLTPTPAGPQPVFGLPTAKPAIPPANTANTTRQLVTPAPVVAPALPQEPTPPSQIIANGRNQTISAPAAKPVFDRNNPVESSEAQRQYARDNNFDKFKRALPKPLREGLFGSELGARFGDRSDRGLIGFLYGGLTKTDNDKFEDRAAKLLEKGIEPERAYEIAYNDVTGNEIKNLTSEEKKVLRNTGLFELGELALDSLDFIPAGTVAKKSIQSSLGVLKNLVSPTAVEKELIEKIGLSKEIAQTISDDIARATKESDIDIIIREAITEARKAEPPVTPSLLPPTPANTADNLAQSIPGVQKASDLPPLKAPKPNQLDATDNMVVDNPVDNVVKTAEKPVDLPVLKAPKPEEIAKVPEPEPVKVAQAEIAEPNINSLELEANNYKNVEEFIAAKTDPLYEYKNLKTIEDPDIAKGTVLEGIDDIGGIENVQRGTVDVDILEISEKVNPNSQRADRVFNAVAEGERTPIIIDEYYRVLDGHHRLIAYQALGLKDIPVIAPKGTEIKTLNSSELTSVWNKVNPKPKKPPLTPEEKAKRAAKRAENAEPNPLKEGEAAAEAKKTAEMRKDPVKALDEIETDRLKLQLAEEALEQNPARGLAKYAGPDGLPEVTGGEGKGKFARIGDDIADEMGFESSEQAREAYLQYRRQREHVADMRQAVKEKTQAYNNRKAILEELKKDIKAEGEARQSQINAVKDFFKFNNNEWSRLLKKLKFQDPRLWSDEKYNKFLDDLQIEGEALYRAIQKRLELNTLIYEREFIKVENLFRAYKFPKITDMSEKQLQLIIDALEKYKQGDEFFTVRQLETIKNTDIADIRTLRQAKEKLAESRGVSIEEVENIGYSKLDKYLYDSALAEKNPFYEEMVLAKSQAFIEAKSNILNIRNRTNELFSAARKSRKDRRLIDRLIPTDKTIFKWLESDYIGKEQLAETMTAEELEAAKYVRGIFEQARDHLVQMQTLKKYRSEYITHIRRGFLEIWKDDGLVKAFKESIEQYKEEQKFFDILNNDTQQILPLEKFFQFSMRRTGGLIPSQNVPKAVEAYFSAFERKKALDSIIPKLDIYANALTPRETSERGLELNRNIKKFTKEWINTKKGRATDTRFVEPGSGLDWGLRTGIAFTRMLDLGFSIPTGLASSVGEQAMTFIAMGSAPMARGTSRMLTKRGREIISRYEEFVGESTFAKIAEASGDVAKRFEVGMFSLFAESARIANMQYLLGNLTKTEWETGIITPKRLAEIQTEMGRWRVVEGATSILGATSPGKALTQYKTWAVPPMMTVARNFKEIRNTLKKDGIKTAMKSKEFKENLRATVFTSSIILAVGAYAESLQDKKTADLNFAQILLQKAYRDSLSLLGALDPGLFTSEPRLLGFAADMSEILTDIVALEGNTLDFLPTYQTGDKKGEIKATDKLEKLLIPASIKQLEGSLDDEKTDTSSGPKAPTPPKPPKPPAPPKPPSPPSPPGR